MLDCPISCPCNDVSICVECDYYYLLGLRDLLEKEHAENMKKLENDREKCYNNNNDM